MRHVFKRLLKPLYPKLLTGIVAALKYSIL